MIENKKYIGRIVNADGSVEMFGLSDSECNEIQKLIDSGLYECDINDFVIDATEEFIKKHKI